MQKNWSSEINGGNSCETRHGVSVRAYFSLVGRGQLLFSYSDCYVCIHGARQKRIWDSPILILAIGSCIWLPCGWNKTKLSPTLQFSMSALSNFIDPWCTLAIRWQSDSSPGLPGSAALLSSNPDCLSGLPPCVSTTVWFLIPISRQLNISR